MRVEDIDCNVAERRRGRDGERVRHVLDETGGGTDDRRQIGRRDTGNGRRGHWGCLRFPFHASRFPNDFLATGLYHRKLGELTVIEEVPPVLPHGLRVAQVLLVHHLHERRVVGTKDELAHEGKSNAAYIVCYETLI